MIAAKLRAGGISIPSGDAFYSSTGTNTFTVPANVTKICIAMTTGTSSNSAGGKTSVVRNSNSTWYGAVASYTSPWYTSSQSGLVLPHAAALVTVTGKGGDATTSAPTFQMNLLYNTHTYTYDGAPYNVPPNPVYLGGSSMPPAYISVSDTNGRYAAIPGDGYGNYNGTAYRATDNAGNLTAVMSFGYQIVSYGGSTVPGTNTTFIVSGGSVTFTGASSGTATMGALQLSLGGTQTSVERTIFISIGSTAGGCYYSWNPNHASNFGGVYSGTLQGATISGNIAYNGVSNNVTSWTNDLTVTPGETFTVIIGSGTGQAVRFMWGAGRSFPSNSA